MAPTEHIVVHDPYLKVGCMLGEGPIYEAAISTLHFVDIIEQKVFHLNISTLQLSSDQFDEPVTCLALRRNGRGLACATSSGIAVIERGKLEYLAQPIKEEDRPYTRFNDGACDSKGRFFIGTIYSRSAERDMPGMLYKFDPKDKSCIIADPGPFTDSNGLGWSLDEKTMYFTDSKTNIIYAYDYDDGNISNRRVFINTEGLPTPFADSSPDGLCIDDQGCIWSARWGGSCVVRFDRSGHVDVQINLPTVYRVTACCFGGPNNDQLFITTAHSDILGGSADLQEKYPDSGHLFKVDFSGKYHGGKWRHEFML